MEKPKETNTQPQQEKKYPELIGIKQMTEDATKLTPEQRAISDAKWDKILEIMLSIKNGTNKRKPGRYNDTKK